MDFQRPDSISGSLPPAFQLTRLIQVSNIYIGEGVEGFAATAFSFIASAGFLPVRPSDPFGRYLALRKPHFDSTLLSAQALSTVESFHYCLLPVNLRAPTSNLCFVFFHFFRESAMNYWPVST